MDNMIYWIWLSLSCTPDSSTFPRLLEKFSDAREVYEADIKEISRAIGFRSSDRRALDDKDLTRAQEIYEFCKKHNVGILAYPDKKYPDSLRGIPTPPVLLYYRGILPDFERDFFVASVGTRSLTDYGRRAAFNLSYDLARTGAIIVSGMAIGIDGVSHAGALAAGAPTIAVLGSGIDVCYPADHLALAREIVKTGCIFTESPPRTKPTRYSFPRRNRIISGLSNATIVIEGGERSGAVITARHAKRQGRPVYALPGNVGNRGSEAANLLLKNGARLVTRAEDIIGDFSSEFPSVLNPFLLDEKRPVDMMTALRTYRVSAVCQGDSIFNSSIREKKQGRKYEKQKHTSDEIEFNRELAQAEAIQPPASFDKRALEIYKMIPVDGDCEIESLIEYGSNLREVMKALLKLEMGQFVVMLPGERVARKKN